MYSMDKFQDGEKFGFYYESDQDSHLSDSDWDSSQESDVCSSQSSYSDWPDSEESDSA